MKKITLIFCITFLFACKNNNQTNKTEQEKQSTSTSTEEAKKGLRNFLSTRLAETESDLKKYPDSTLLVNTKTFITEKLKETK